MYTKALVGGQVYRNGAFEHATIYLQGDKIAAITLEQLEAETVYDVRGFKVLPGLIDPHVHLALDLGAVTSCDNFYTGSKAAAFGGITTLLDFLEPIGELSELPEALAKRQQEVVDQGCLIDYGFHGTLGNYRESTAPLVDAINQLGLFGVKVFSAYSESNRKISDASLMELLDSDILTLIHAEKDDLCDSQWTDIATFESSRPLSSELEMLTWLRGHLGRGRLYVVHVSSGSGVEILKDHPQISIETCPHYVYLDRSLYGQQKPRPGSLYLMAPPLRDLKEVARLRALIDDVHTIGTDHCPFMLSEKLKSSDASKVPKGIGSIAYSFLLMFNLFGFKVIDKMSADVASIFGIPNKGRLEVGYDADITLFDETGETVAGVLSDYGHSACDYSPYEGLRLKGAMVGTMSRGQWVVYKGEWYQTRGKYLKR